jgi:hypothetical protein
VAFLALFPRSEASTQQLSVDEDQLARTTQNQRAEQNRPRFSGCTLFHQNTLISLLFGGHFSYP